MDDRFDFDADTVRDERPARHTEARRAAAAAAAEPEEDEYYEESGMVIPPALFWCIIAITVIMLAAVIFLGVRLVKAGNGSADADIAAEQVEQYKAEITELEKKLNEANEDYDALQTNYDEYRTAKEQEIAELKQAQEEAAQQTAQQPTTDPVEDDYWLDLTGHSELKQKPEELFSEYKTYYVKATTLNVRAGKDTNQPILFTVKKGDAVKVAAIDGQWAFINFGDKYGWTKTEYLSTTAVAAATTTKPAGSSSTKPSTGGSEATSGNLGG